LRSRRPSPRRRPAVDRFLAPDRQPLIGYRVNHITASTRGGKMSAAIEAWTPLDPQHGFTWESRNPKGQA
jgi:hypothetical protein